MKLMKNTLSTVSKLIAIAIGDRKATIEIAIGDLFSNGVRDLKSDQDRDRDRDRNFRDRGHALVKPHLLSTFFQFFQHIYKMEKKTLFSVTLFIERYGNYPKIMACQSPYGDCPLIEPWFFVASYVVTDTNKLTKRDVDNDIPH